MMDCYLCHFYEVRQGGGRRGMVRVVETVRCSVNGRRELTSFEEDGMQSFDRERSIGFIFEMGDFLPCYWRLDRDQWSVEIN